ncbi:MAG: hypothetical protein ACYDCC_10895 [Actinomycetota bacterium]
MDEPDEAGLLALLLECPAGLPDDRLLEETLELGLAKALCLGVLLRRDRGGVVMSRFVVAMPVPPAVRKEGPASHARGQGSNRSQLFGDWWIEPTPNGDLAIFYLESDDMASGIANLATSKESEEVWFKQSLLDATGIDYEAPPPPLPELVFDWRV